MPTDKLILALSCCAYADKAERKCNECPLRNSNIDCHVALCFKAINLLYRIKDVVEHGE